VTDLAWRTLATPAGARHVRDAKRFASHLKRRRVLVEERERLQRESSRLLQDPSPRKNEAARRLLEVCRVDEQRHDVDAER
jgi:hypothetical protein